MSKILNQKEWSDIRTLFKEGYGKKTIARKLGISRNTVRRALASEDPPKYVRKKQKVKKIDHFKEKIHYMYFEKKIAGIMIYKELVSQGYEGTLSTLYKYLKKIRNDK